jgi:hypothetical protein
MGPKSHSALSRSATGNGSAMAEHWARFPFIAAVIAHGLLAFYPRHLGL